jgi:transposase
MEDSATSCCLDKEVEKHRGKKRIASAVAQGSCPAVVRYVAFFPTGKGDAEVRRWVVERTFSWLSQNRRMSKDYERLCASAEAFVYAAMVRLMVRRLARA